MKVIKWWKLSSGESYLMMTVIWWWKLSSDESYLVMKVKGVDISKEVIRSDGWWRFACGDVLCGPARIPLKFIIDTGISTLPKRKNAFSSQNSLQQCKILLLLPRYSLVHGDLNQRDWRFHPTIHYLASCSRRWTAPTGPCHLQLSPSNFLRLSMESFCNYQWKLSAIIKVKLFAITSVKLSTITNENHS